MTDKLKAVGAVPVLDKNDPKAYADDGDKAKEIRKDQSTDYQGGPLTDPGPLHPTQTVEDSPAYRRADGSRHRKDT